MRHRIITSVIAFSLLATVPAWGQTSVIKRTPATSKISKGNTCKRWSWKNPYYEGLALVYDVNGNGKFGFVDKAENLVIECKWKKAGNFSEGLAFVEDENGKRGFIDKKGNLVIPCIWKETASFKEGLVWVEDEKDRVGFIDRTGAVIIPLGTYPWLDKSFRDGLLLAHNNNKYGFIDKDDKVVIPFQWADIGHKEIGVLFREGLCKVKDSNGKYGYIGKDGTLVIPCKWRWAHRFSEGLAGVCDNNGKYGFIDKNGKVIIPFKWESVRENFKNGKAVVWGEKPIKIAQSTNKAKS